MFLMFVAVFRFEVPTMIGRLGRKINDLDFLAIHGRKEEGKIIQQQSLSIPITDSVINQCCDNIVLIISEI